MNEDAYTNLKWMAGALRPYGPDSGAHCELMESDRQASFLFGCIFFDEPVSTSSETALVVRLLLDALAFCCVPNARNR